MIDAFFFPVETPIAEARTNWFRTFGFELKPWPGTTAAADAQVVLLATPVRCHNNQFVFPEGVWKRYLTKINPKTKLILIGLRSDISGPNYLHWFQPPSDFYRFWMEAKPVSELTLPPARGFVTLETIWKRFWDGHDKGGFQYYFSEAKMPIRIALDNLADKPENISSQKAFLEDIGLEHFLKNCQNRWAHYRPFWEVTPFVDKIVLLQNHVSYFWINLSGLRVGTTFAAELESLQRRIAEAEQIFSEIASHLKP